MAELAGIGVDWYVRMEQGRSVRPSRATLAALATALRLDAVEAAHLQVLAGSPGHDAFAREAVPSATRRLVHGLGQPAYLTGRRWDVLAWNTAAVDLLTDFGRARQEDRNILVYLGTAAPDDHREHRRLRRVGPDRLPRGLPGDLGALTRPVATRQPGVRRPGVRRPGDRQAQAPGAPVGEVYQPTRWEWDQAPHGLP